MPDGLQKTGLKKGLKYHMGEEKCLLDNSKHYIVSAAWVWTKH